jgi:tetratricopeptide (TPR) repeat protein
MNSDMGFFDRFKKIPGTDKPGDVRRDQATGDAEVIEAGRVEERDLSIPVAGFEDSREKKDQGKPTSFIQPLREEAAIYFRRGNAYFKLQNYERSIQDYSRAIDVFPEYIEAYYNRAIAYKYVENYLKAIEDYSMIVEIAPNFVAAYAGRATLYTALNDHVSALEDMKMAARLGLKDIQDLLKAKGVQW